MITFKINGVKYPFPTRWEDITYQQYFDLIRSKTLTDHISIFTGIPRETLDNAELKNLEKISIALSFLSFAPKFDRTKMVGPYVLPKDVTVQSTIQFEALRSLLVQMPKDLNTIENNELLQELYLSACAVYCQKLRDGKFDALKVPELKEELKNYSAAEVIGTGAFFLFRPLNTLGPSMTLFQRLLLLLKRWKQGWKTSRKTSDSKQSSTGSAGK